MATANQYYKSEPERSVRSDIIVLLAMCSFAFLVLGAFIAFKVLPQTDVEVGAFFNSYFDKRDDKSFKLGTVQLGSSIEQVRKRHVSAIKGVTADGSVTLAFLDGNDSYMVWYGENGPLHIAYKARQTRVITDASEDEFIGSIAERYGAPSLSTCSRRIADGLRDCQFSWWIPGEVRLDVNSRQDLHAARRADGAALKVTMQITDTRAEGRLRRTAQRTRTLNAY